MSLKENIRYGLDQIIQYHSNKGALHARAEAAARSFAKYLEDQTDYTRGKLEEVIQKINYETIRPHETSQLWPDLEFWRGPDDFESSVALSYDGDVDILSDYEPIVMTRHNSSGVRSDAERIQNKKNRQSIRLDLDKYPVSLLGYYEYKFSETALFYAWMGFLWQEVEGYKCGIKVKTVENNSIAIFSLNDFLDSDFSSFTSSGSDAKPPKIENFFPRKLNLIELYLRAVQTGYPFNPFKNYWRYFEKNDEFTEIVAYAFATGIRAGKRSERQTAVVTQVIQHQDSKSALMYLTDFTNKMIFEGWEEQLRPIGMPAQMHKDAYDFEIWTGIHWTAEQRNRIDEQTIRAFEAKYQIQLPNSFFQYIRLLNGRQYNSYNLYFPVNDLYTVKVGQFYTINELEKVASSTIAKNPNCLWIGELEDNKMLGIYIDEKSDDYGKMVLSSTSDNFEICDYTFEKFARYAQDPPVQPEIFAAQENDTDFLRKRLSEGWDYRMEYNDQTAVAQAAEYNSHEALELLLKAGARLPYGNHRDFTWLYDEKTMEILDQYR